MIEEIKIDRLEELIHEMMRKIHDTYPTESAEGNPIEIDNAAAAPLVKCVTAITGSQTGTGTPSPDNVRPITAYNSGSVEVEGEESNSTTYATTFPAEIYRGSEDLVKGEVTYDMKVIDMGDLTWVKSTSTPNTFSATLADYKFALDVAMLSSAYNYEGTTNVGTPALATKPNYSFMAYYKSGDNYREIYVKDTRFSNVNDFTAAVDGVMLAYELATPATASVTVSNAPISSVHGYNKIESSTGELEVTYITEDFEPLVPTT